MQYGDSPYVATTDDGKMIGFFCYSVDLQTNIGKFKFVMVAPAMRGKGIGKEMLQLAVQYAFDITKADAVQLNVYPINTGAKRCYEKVGFVENMTRKNAFQYKDESWDSCNMVIKKTGV